MVAPSFPDKQALILQILANTKGEAADWAGPHISQIIQRDSQALQNFKDFSEAFKWAFQDSDIKRVSAQKITKLKQMADIEA